MDDDSMPSFLSIQAQDFIEDCCRMSGGVSSQSDS